MKTNIPGISPLVTNPSGAVFTMIPGGVAVAINKPGIGYLLRDLFPGTLTAGDVDGTLSTSGDERTVRDLDDVITVGSGWLEFGAQTDGSPGYAREDLVYALPAITRQLGQVVMCKWRCATDNPHYPLALVNSQTPVWTAYEDVIHGFYRSAALTLGSVDNEAAGVPLMPFVADGTEYLLAMYLLATGVYYFAKGGAYTDWTFLRFSEVGTATPLYVASSGLTAIFSVTNIEVPQSLFLGDLVAED
jgi:hypothetical protein